MVKRQINDFPVVDSDGKESVLVVLVGDSEEVGLFACQFGQIGRVHSLLVELSLFRGQLRLFLLILKILQPVVLQFQLLESLGVLSGSIEINGGIGGVPVDELGLNFGDEVVLGDQAVLKVDHGCA